MFCKCDIISAEYVCHEYGWCRKCLRETNKSTRWVIHHVYCQVALDFMKENDCLKWNRQDDCQYVHDEVSTWLYQLCWAVIHAWTHLSILGWHCVRLITESLSFSLEFSSFYIWFHIFCKCLKLLLFNVIFSCVYCKEMGVSGDSVSCRSRSNTSVCLFDIGLYKQDDDSEEKQENIQNVEKQTSQAPGVYWWSSMRIPGHQGGGVWMPIFTFHADPHWSP